MWATACRALQKKSGISLWNPLPSSVNANPVLRVHQIPWQPPCISPHFPTLMLNHSLLFGLLNASILRFPSDSSSAADPVICTHFLYLVLKLQTTSVLEVSIWINSREWWENTAISPVCRETQPDSHRWGHSRYRRYMLENRLTNLLQHVENLPWEFTFLSWKKTDDEAEQNTGLWLVVHLQTLGAMYSASSQAEEPWWAPPLKGIGYMQHTPR